MRNVQTTNHLSERYMRFPSLTAKTDQRSKGFIDNQDTSAINHQDDV